MVPVAPVNKILLMGFPFFGLGLSTNRPFAQAVDRAVWRSCFLLDDLHANDYDFK